MAAPGDSIDPTDDVLFQLRRGLQPDELPIMLLCPAGHDAQRHIIDAGEISIPYYVCVPCTVVYRYHECRLAPGDEGRPE
jgi:hypothetical protein